MTQSCSRMSLAVSLALIALARAAHAGEQQAAAQAAFDDGRRLMALDQLDEACARFEASQKLDPATGTLANLAACEEARGRVATAWADWVAVRDRSLRDGNTQREQQALAHIASLVPRLPRLQIVIAEATPELEVRRNGEPVPAAMLSASFPVDPGPQRIAATAPARIAWRTEVTAVEGQVVTVTIAPLDLEPAAPPSHGRTWRIAGVATGVAGLAAIALGITYHREARRLSDDVSGATAWSAALDREVADGRAADRRAYLCYGLGAAAIATGAVLVYVGYRSEREAPPLSIHVGPEGATFAVHGAF